MLFRSHANTPAESTQQQATVPIAATPALAMRQLPDFVSLVEAQGPAVVNISVTGKTEARDGQNQAMPDIPELFKRFGIPQPMPGNPGEMPERHGRIVAVAHRRQMPGYWRERK